MELESTLRLIANGGRVMVDYDPNGRGNAALVIKPEVRLISTGIKGDGQGAWAVIDTEKGRVGILSKWMAEGDAPTKFFFS
ncbi:hypothetical protein R1sor_024193 [Riccia sorocarpa]|uniref:Uncharacterized protein n=1 Tax=Riccia sorocarpa TaxID=122646 RepID=A0ABD3GS05_9MARC